MPSTPTPNLSLTYPLATEQVSNGPADFAAIVNILDAGTNGPTATRILPGTLASRPTASSTALGTIYVCTDVPCFFVRDGQPAWRYVPLDGNAEPVGVMMQYAGSSDPVDVDGTTRWLVCDGRAISRTAYATLFGKTSTTYGSGDGSTTFNIPDLRGRVSVGADPTGVHLPVNEPARGASGGEEQHTLTTTEMPSHNHSVSTNFEISGAASTGSGEFGLEPGSWTTANTGGGSAHTTSSPISPSTTSSRFCERGLRSMSKCRYWRRLVGRKNVAPVAPTWHRGVGPQRQGREVLAGVQSSG